MSILPDLDFEGVILAPYMDVYGAEALAILPNLKDETVHYVLGNDGGETRSYDVQVDGQDRWARLSHLIPLFVPEHMLVARLEAMSGETLNVVDIT